MFLGTHEWKAGSNYAHSSYDGRETFLPIEIIGASGAAVERITFTPPASFGIDQNETAWFVADQWAPSHAVDANPGYAFRQR